MVLICYKIMVSFSSCEMFMGSGEHLKLYIFCQTSEHKNIRKCQNTNKFT